ncbi:ArsR/SmtB family transcription factor [Microbacterium sp.]|uniref:ArsR/SmtB family transcription factor n=1 Tax=Microbacterium sp. TaxID=51671 RepID=UPI003A908560
MDDDDRVFKALADPTRRRLLDALFEQDGLSLTELEAVAPDMTRFGVMKHVKLLVEAGLVVTRKDGRRTRHHLNPVPIRTVHDRWIHRYVEGRAAALSDLKQRLESS